MDWEFTSFYPFMDIILSADHFKILIGKSFFLQCTIRKILIF